MYSILQISQKCVDSSKCKPCRHITILTLQHIEEEEEEHKVQSELMLQNWHAISDSTDAQVVCIHVTADTIPWCGHLAKSTHKSQQLSLAPETWRVKSATNLEEDYMTSGQARKSSSQLCPDQRGAVIGDWQQLAGYCPFSCQSILLTHAGQGPTLIV